jgi:uncharacterized protein YoaH (UPF0181 family)
MSDELKQIRDIAQRFTPGEIEGCIVQQIETGKNICLTDEHSEKVINELSKAGVVRDFMSQGMSLADALRELAKRMRLVQSGFKELKDK